MVSARGAASSIPQNTRLVHHRHIPASARRLLAIMLHGRTLGILGYTHRQNADQSVISGECALVGRQRAIRWSAGSAHLCQISSWWPHLWHGHGRLGHQDLGPQDKNKSGQFSGPHGRHHVSVVLGERLLFGHGRRGLSHQIVGFAQTQEL